MINSYNLNTRQAYSEKKSVVTDDISKTAESFDGFDGLSHE
jgi:hypothetical protein